MPLLTFSPYRRSYRRNAASRRHRKPPSIFPIFSAAAPNNGLSVSQYSRVAPGLPPATLRHRQCPISLATAALRLLGTIHDVSPAPAQHGSRHPADCFPVFPPRIPCPRAAPIHTHGLPLPPVPSRHALVFLPTVRSRATSPAIVPRHPPDLPLPVPHVPELPTPCAAVHLFLPPAASHVSAPAARLPRCRPVPAVSAPTPFATRAGGRVGRHVVVRPLGA
ncbi:hypothetical protein DFH08DRAFT_892204 [Mycena albidolilacea]|uniref:Uncharacterized protein n=1 Tax=Mycena albidolilacea TaxID=1033008 RepID=A0AAD6ZEI5_9AGAR|nr:hypothetical protein DFH08DRAFT_892204 [Mycena albidolilacea]